MSTQTRYPTAETAQSGTWGSLSNFGASDSAVATLTVAASQYADVWIGTYGFDGVLPASISVQSVVVEVRVTARTGSGYLMAAPLVNGWPYPKEGNGRYQAISTTVPTTYTFDITDDLPTGTFTRADLLNASFNLLLRVSGGSAGATASFDYARVVVTYLEGGGASITGDSTAIMAYSTGGAGKTAADLVPRIQVEVRRGGLPDHFEMRAALDSFISLRHTRRFNAAGDFTLTVGDDHPDLEALITRRAVVRVLRNGVEEFAGLTMHRSANFDGGRGTWQWTLTGPDLTGLFRKRIAAVASGDVVSISGTPGSVIQTLVTDNYISPVSGIMTNRQQFYGGSGNASDVRIGAITGAGDTVTLSASNQSIGDLLRDLCQAGGVGYRLGLDLGLAQAVLDVYPGVDRSFPSTTGEGVLLAFSADNVTSLTYEDDGLNLLNSILVGGDGAGANRLMSVVSDTDSQDDWGVHEGFIDYRIAGTSTAALTTAGKLRAALRSSSERVTVRLVDTGGCGYRTHWDVGDTVTVHVPTIDLLIDLQVTEVTTTVDHGQASPTIEVTFGTPPYTILSKLRDMQLDAFAVTQQLPPEAIATLVAGGTTVSDADFAHAPRNGSIAVIVDGGGKARLWARHGGSWSEVVANAP